MRRAPRRLLGPLAAALWAAGPDLAVASEVKTSPVVTSLALFAGSPAGLWRSRDWGGSWDLARGREDGALQGLGAVHAILPLGPRALLGGEGGLYVSEDFGETWKRTDLTVPILALLTSRYPQADPTVFAGTRDGLLKSADGGLTFRPTVLTGTPVYRLEWPGPALLAATGRGVVVSVDAGGSFSGPGSGLPEGEVSSLALSSFFVVDPVVFAGVGRAGVFRSPDGGTSWSAAGLAGHAVSDLVWLGPLLYAATDRGVYRTEDLGRTWTPLREGLRVRDLLIPLAPDSGAEVFAATERGVSRSVDGGLTWSPSGLEGESVLCLATFPAPEPAPSDKKRPKKP